MKCSRCEEEMSLIERKYVNGEIICEKCYEKAKESGEVVEKESILFPSVKILKILDIIYLIVSMVSVFNTLNSTSDPNQANAAVLSTVRILLVFFAIWVITVIAQLLIKIHIKLK